MKLVTIAALLLLSTPTLGQENVTVGFTLSSLDFNSTACSTENLADGIGSAIQGFTLSDTWNSASNSNPGGTLQAGCTTNCPTPDCFCEQLCTTQVRRRLRKNARALQVGVCNEIQSAVESFIEGSVSSLQTQIYTDTAGVVPAEREFCAQALNNSVLDMTCVPQ